MNSNLYKRPNKPKLVTVKSRKGAPPGALPQMPEGPIYVDTATECHVTPDHIADYMVECLDACSDHFCIEPSAGTGSLISALLRSGHPSNRITAIEKYNSLSALLDKKYADTPLLENSNQCFFDFSCDLDTDHRPVYQRALINPPFRKSKAHLNALIGLLNNCTSPDWVIVALVPVTYNHINSELIDILPDDTFELAKVNTKIIRIESQ